MILFSDVSEGIYPPLRSCETDIFGRRYRGSHGWLILLHYDHQSLQNEALDIILASFSEEGFDNLPMFLGRYVLRQEYLRLFNLVLQEFTTEYPSLSFQRTWHRG